MGTDLTLWLAFLAGLLSFISPCVLPLIPAYVGYLAGQVTTQTVRELTVGAGAMPGTRAARPATKRLSTLLHGVFFVGGFTLVFVTLGLLTNVSLQALGAYSYAIKVVLSQGGGLLVIFFGLQVMGVNGWILRILLTRIEWSNLGIIGCRVQQTLEHIQGWLYGDTRRQLSAGRSHGYARSSLLGITFAAGWTPCIGPIYGAILTVAASRYAVGSATALLLAYSLGLGTPFLLTAIALDRMRSPLRRLQRHMRLIELFSGTFLILIGYLLFSGQLASLAQAGTGLANFSYNLEACVTQVVQGKLTIGELGHCMSFGPDVQSLPVSPNSLPYF
ncbi:MAG: cytochrome c biogenesis CcdA family protein [Aggregatilineales bacterium]